MASARRSATRRKLASKTPAVLPDVSVVPSVPVVACGAKAGVSLRRGSATATSPANVETRLASAALIVSHTGHRHNISSPG